MTNPLTDEVIDKAVELLPCPFCGSNSFIFLRVDSNNYAVICQYTTNHGCGMRGPYGKSRKEAGIRWNTRAAAAKVIESALAGDIGWISVDARLPKCSNKPESFGVEVLVYPPTREGDRTAFYGRRVSSKPCFYRYGSPISPQPNYWMPLPKDPESAIKGKSHE